MFSSLMQEVHKESLIVFFLIMLTQGCLALCTGNPLCYYSTGYPFYILFHIHIILLHT